VILAGFDFAPISAFPNDFSIEKVCIHFVTDRLEKRRNAQELSTGAGKSLRSSEADLTIENQRQKGGCNGENYHRI